MLRRYQTFIVALILILGTVFAIPNPSQAESAIAPGYAETPYDLINAVNALRASNGLSPYSINSVLMYTAQAHADFMAATGSVSHTGAGGLGVTDRLLAAGYPLGGDLSLGGFRSENITSGSENMSAQAAVDQWTGDAPHLNTMLSPNLTEIGAGVAVASGRIYYVIDAARPANSTSPPPATPVVGGGSIVPAGEAPIPIVAVSTPNVEGNVIHEVLSGQSLWQIAIAYNVKIDDIKRLNNLFDNDIYPGNKLVIKTGVVMPSATPTEFPTVVTPTSSPAVVIPYTPTILQTATTPVSISTVSPVSTDSNKVLGIVIGIIVLALLGGGIFTWLGTSRNT